MWLLQQACPAAACFACAPASAALAAHGSSHNSSPLTPQQQQQPAGAPPPGTRFMGTERRPGVSGAWKQSECVLMCSCSHPAPASCPLARAHPPLAVAANHHPRSRPRQGRRALGERPHLQEGAQKHGGGWVPVPVLPSPPLRMVACVHSYMCMHACACAPGPWYTHAHTPHTHAQCWTTRPPCSSSRTSSGACPTPWAPSLTRRSRWVVGGAGRWPRVRVHARGAAPAHNTPAAPTAGTHVP